VICPITSATQSRSVLRYLKCQKGRGGRIAVHPAVSWCTKGGVAARESDHRCGGGRLSTAATWYQDMSSDSF